MSALVLTAMIVVPARLPAETMDAGDRSGFYLTHGAGQCTDCHGSDLRGGPAPKGPPGVPWASHAPSLVGLHMFHRTADAVRFLTTTRLPGGGHALPPMPRYTFTTKDATAIVAYLRALK